MNVKKKNIIDIDALNTEIDNLNHERDALVAERDHLNHERNALVAERDHLNHERQRFLNSTSWKLTKPLRILSSLMKGSLKPKSFVGKVVVRIQKNKELKEEKKRSKDLGDYIKSGNPVSIKKLYNHHTND